VYGGKTEAEPWLPECPSLEPLPDNDPVPHRTDKEGRLCSLGRLRFKQPMTVNILRATIDNDRFDPALRHWNGAKSVAYSVEENGNRVKVKGKVVKNCHSPLMEYEIEYLFHDRGADISFSYEISDWVLPLPRIGLEFALGKRYRKFSYTGYGPFESYADKHLASSYGDYENTAQASYFHYVRPQESGSRFASTRLTLDGALEVTAEKPFSFSVLPYSTAELTNAAHDFELPESERIYVNLDLAMSGVGSHSCGPMLDEKYMTPKKGKNTFRIRLLK